MLYYKIFYTDVELPAGAQQPDLTMVLPLEFPSRDEAMLKAFKLMRHGAIVWKIDGPEGFHLERAEIERQYQLFKIA